MEFSLNLVQPSFVFGHDTSGNPISVPEIKY